MGPHPANAVYLCKPLRLILQYIQCIHAKGGYYILCGTFAYSLDKAAGKICRQRPKGCRGQGLALSHLKLHPIGTVLRPLSLKLYALANGR